MEFGIQHSMSMTERVPAQGAHTQFKQALRSTLLKRVESTVRARSGPSFDERVDKAKKVFQRQQTAVETEQVKTLSEAVDRGRSRPTSAPVRSLGESPNQHAMLRRRQKDMKRLESDYKSQVEDLKEKMQKREPLYRLSEVNAAFAMQRRRMQEKKHEMQQEEHERWAHLRSVEENAARRPLLIEESGLRAPKRKAPAAEPASKTQDVDEHTSKAGATEYFGRDEYEKDIKIRNAISAKWFQSSDWAHRVAEIRHRADTRLKLHEESYANKGDAHALVRHRLMHSSCARVRPASAGLLC